MTKNIPAFPRPNTVHWDSAYESPVGDEGTEGMTLRDYFAAEAMQAMLSEGFVDDIPNPDYVRLDKNTLAEAVAQSSYKFADAMLAQREKES